MLRKIIIFSLFAAMVAPLVLLSLVLDPAPQVTTPQTPDSVAARQTKQLLKDSWDVLKQEQKAELTVRVEDLNAAAAFLRRGVSSLSGHFSLEQQVLHGSFSLELPATPFGRYLNVDIAILPSEQGLHVANCRIGKLTIPGRLTHWAVEFLLNLLGKEQLGSRLLDTIESLSFSDQTLQVSFRSGAEFGRLKNRLLAVLKELVRQQDATAELGRVSYYLQVLDRLNQQNPNTPKSLSHILGPLFRQLQQATDSSPEQENRAALSALAIYLGGWEFHRLSSYLLNPPEPFPRNTRTRFLLSGRSDLRQHFLVSAGLKLYSDANIGFAIGEFKELLDTDSGGSGFSFIDLAADRCGLWFAERATASTQSALRFQQMLPLLTDELAFFPDFSDLEEGLSEMRFIDRYGNIDSSRYQEVVTLIDRRLASLPLYQ